MDCKILLRGISPEMTEDRLRDHFARYGHVVQAVISRDKLTRRPRGTGFLIFAGPAALNRLLADKHRIDATTELRVSRDSTITKPQPFSFETKNRATARATKVIQEKDVLVSKASKKATPKPFSLATERRAVDRAGKAEKKNSRGLDENRGKSLVLGQGGSSSRGGPSSHVVSNGGAGRKNLTAGKQKEANRVPTMGAKNKISTSVSRAGLATGRTKADQLPSFQECNIQVSDVVDVTSSRESSVGDIGGLDSSSDSSLAGVTNDPSVEGEPILVQEYAKQVSGVHVTLLEECSMGETEGVGSSYDIMLMREEDATDSYLTGVSNQPTVETSKWKPKLTHANASKPSAECRDLRPRKDIDILHFVESENVIMPYDFQVREFEFSELSFGTISGPATDATEDCSMPSGTSKWKPKLTYANTCKSSADCGDFRPRKDIGILHFVESENVIMPHNIKVGEFERSELSFGTISATFRRGSNVSSGLDIDQVTSCQRCTTQVNEGFDVFSTVERSGGASDLERVSNIDQQASPTGKFCGIKRLGWAPVRQSNKNKSPGEGNQSRTSKNDHVTVGRNMDDVQKDTRIKRDGTQRHISKPIVKELDQHGNSQNPYPFFDQPASSNMNSNPQFEPKSPKGGRDEGSSMYNSAENEVYQISKQGIVRAYWRPRDSQVPRMNNQFSQPVSSAPCQQGHYNALKQISMSRALQNNSHYQCECQQVVPHSESSDSSKQISMIYEEAQEVPQQQCIGSDIWVPAAWMDFSIMPVNDHSAIQFGYCALDGIYYPIPTPTATDSYQILKQSQIMDDMYYMPVDSFYSRPQTQQMIGAPLQHPQTMEDMSYMQMSSFYTQPQAQQMISAPTQPEVYLPLPQSQATMDMGYNGNPYYTLPQPQQMPSMPVLHSQGALEGFYHPVDTVPVAEPNLHPLLQLLQQPKLEPVLHSQGALEGFYHPVDTVPVAEPNLHPLLQLLQQPKLEPISWDNDGALNEMDHPIQTVEAEIHPLLQLLQQSQTFGSRDTSFKSGTCPTNGPGTEDSSMPYGTSKWKPKLSHANASKSSADCGDLGPRKDIDILHFVESENVIMPHDFQVREFDNAELIFGTIRRPATTEDSSVPSGTSKWKPKLSHANASKSSADCGDLGPRKDIDILHFVESENVIMPHDFQVREFENAELSFGTISRPATGDSSMPSGTSKWKPKLTHANASKSSADSGDLGSIKRDGMHRFICKPNMHSKMKDAKSLKLEEEEERAKSGAKLEEVDRRILAQRSNQGNVDIAATVEMG